MKSSSGLVLALGVLGVLFLGCVGSIAVLVFASVVLVQTSTEDDEPPATPQEPEVTAPDDDGRMAPRVNPEAPASPGLAPNSNAVLAPVRPKLAVTASSQWSDPWTAKAAFDGNAKTTWYSSTRGGAQSPAHWIMVQLPGDATVARVTVFGTRDSAYGTQYQIAECRIELLDGNERVLSSATPPAVGKDKDFDFRPPEPVMGVRKIRVTSLKHAESQRNDVAIAEVQVE